MTVYEAIHQMRVLTAKRVPFAFSYMSYSMQREQSHGEVEVEHALLIKNPKAQKSEYDDYMLTYYNQDTDEAHHFWQPLLMTFNHEPLTSID